MRPQLENDEPVILGLPLGRPEVEARMISDVVDGCPLPNSASEGKEVARTVIGLSLVLWLALCGPALCGLVYTADDLGAFHLPLRAFYARALENGDAFDWCPNLYGGFYLTGEGQAGTYHPLHWLLYRFLPLSWAWNIECLSSYPLLFGGVCLMLRRRGLAPAESLFGAAMFTFCGFNLLHFVHVNAIAVVAHIPWLLYSIDRLATRRTDWQSVLQNACLVAGLTCSQLLLGYPQYILYSLAAEALYLAFVLREHKSAGNGQSALTLGLIWATAKLLGLALAAVQVLPTIEALGDSVRQGIDSSFSTSGSLHPLNVVQLVAPYLFTTRVAGQNTHELSLYFGVVPLLLAIVALTNWRREHAHPSLQLVRRFALVLALVGGLTALGKHGPLHELLAYVPIVGYFRFPCRAIVLVELGVGLLAATGFAAICHANRGEQSLVLPQKTFWLVGLLGFAAAIAGPMVWPEHTAADWRIWIGPVAIVIAIACLNLAASGSRLAVHAVVVLAAIDVGAYGLSYAVYRDAYPLSEFIDHAPLPPSDRGRRVALDLARPDDDAFRAGNQILLRGFSRIDGYSGLEPTRLLDYRRPAALRAAGVAIVAADAAIVKDQSLQTAGHEWLLVAEPLPRVRIARSIRATDNPAAEISRIDLTKEVLIERADQALVETHLAGTATEMHAEDFVQIVSDRPGNIAVETSASRPAILAINESHHRGWNAVVCGLEPAQGQRVPVIRVNGDFLGCLVPEGHSTVEFRFAPDSLRHGRLISVCSLGLLVILAAAATWHGAVSARRPAPLPRFRASRGD